MNPEDHIRARIPFEDYESGEAEYGELEYKIFYRAGVEPRSRYRKLLRPLIVLDGFDPGDERKIDSGKDPMIRFLDYPVAKGQYRSLLSDLRNRGYDLIFVNFPKHRHSSIDGGSDYIERNALAVVELLKRVRKEARSQPEGEATVLVGPSMGGLISRYALAYMEKKRKETGNDEWHHDVRLWLSLDAPQLGAHVSVGIQTLARDLVRPHEGIREQLEEIIDSTAAKQMLLERFDGNQTLVARYLDNGKSIAGGDWYFRKFFENLLQNGVPGAGGYPVDPNLRKIAIVNGSLAGSPDYKDPKSGRMMSYPEDSTPILNIRGFERTPPPFRFSSLALSIEALAGPPKGRSGRVSKIYIKQRPRKMRDASTDSVRGNLDNAPSGWNGLLAKKIGQKTVAEAEHLVRVASIFRASLEVRTRPGALSFIPTFSAIGHLRPSGSWHAPLSRNLVCSGETPFDSYYGEKLNTEHVSFTKKSAEWFIKEVEQQPQLPVFPSQGKMEIAGPDLLCSGDTVEFSLPRCAGPGKPVRWRLPGGVYEVASDGHSVEAEVGSLSSGEHSVRAYFEDGTYVEKSVWTGPPTISHHKSGRCLNQELTISAHWLSKSETVRVNVNGRSENHYGNIYTMYALDRNNLDEFLKIEASAKNRCGWSRVDSWPFLFSWGPECHGIPGGGDEGPGGGPV